MAKRARALLLPPPPEKEVQGRIVQLYTSLGGEVWDTSQPHNRVLIRPGLPDLLVFLPRRAAFWVHEVKRPKGLTLYGEEVWTRSGPEGKLTEEQVLFRDLCRQAGVDHVVGGYDAAEQYLIEKGWAERAGLTLRIL